MDKVIGWRRFSVVVLLLCMMFILKLKGLSMDTVTAGVVVSVVGAWIGLDLKAKLSGINK